MRPVDKTDKPKKLYKSLATPSVVNSYSIAMQYIKNWFFSKFDEDFFKSIYVDQQHPLEDFRKIRTINNALKKQKPSVAISSQINSDYNRDNVDLYQAPISVYLKRTKHNNSFFNDPEKNLNLSVLFRVMEINFGFKIRLSTRAQQLDVLENMMLAFRIGSTQGEYINMDCHIPYPLMMQVAADAGFEIKDDKVVDIIGFIRYMNQRSVVPILYKFRTVNGKEEFFMRMSDLYVHISCLDYPSLDDGEQNGQLHTNFIIDFNVILKIPTPQFYAYHSTEEHNTLRNITKRMKGNSIGLYNIKIPKIPEMDEHGWNQYLITEYYSDEINKPISIEMEDFFKNSDLFKIIKQSRDMYLSPEIFLNIKFYTNGDLVRYDINWQTFTINILDPIDSNVIQIVVYADLDYLKTAMYNEDKLKERFTTDDK